MDGTSLAPLMRGESDSLHEFVFTEFGTFASAHTRDWHYFQHTSGDNTGKGPALYDLNVDPKETENVLAKNGEAVAEMRSRLEEKLGYSLP